VTYPVVHLIWLDSEACAEWTELNSVSNTLNITHSVGLLVKQSEDFILLALSYDPETESINGFKKIPRAAIKDVRTLCSLKMSQI